MIISKSLEKLRYIALKIFKNLVNKILIKFKYANSDDKLDGQQQTLLVIHLMWHNFTGILPPMHSHISLTWPSL